RRFGRVHRSRGGDATRAVRRGPVPGVHDQNGPDFPPDRCGVHPAVVDYVVMVRRWYEYRARRWTGDPRHAGQQNRKVDGRSMHGAGSGYRMARVGTLRRNVGLIEPGFGNMPEETQQGSPQRYTAQLPGPPAVRTRHRVGRIFIGTEHRHQDVQMRGVLQISSGGVLRELSDRLTDWSLHLVRIRLGQDVVEVEVQQRLIDAVEVLQVGEPDQSAVAKSIGLVRGQLAPGVASQKRQRDADGCAEAAVDHRATSRPW